MTTAATATIPDDRPPSTKKKALQLLGSPTHGIRSLHVALLDLEIHVLFPNAWQPLAELVSRVLRQGREGGMGSNENNNRATTKRKGK